ncbi:MAG TPA: Crp/Fnr family transcriptional regulator [Terriglobia bacterium]|jgi:CRP/FNR family transcriptional regulator|nr:Crp/Fnr family transcriptional regulator [Terriglobia bacterium]
MADTKANRIETLKSVPLFADLTERELSLLADRALSREYQPGEIIFSEGDPCEGLYVVQSGNVKIFNTSSSGREQVLHIEKAGNSLAELPVFDGGSYPASTSAIGKCKLLFISKKDLRKLCMERPEVSLKVLKVVSSRLRQLVSIIEELSFTTVRNRLASWLLQQAKTSGRQTAQGIEFNLALSNQELAFQIGTVRELVSRNLSYFQSEGMLKIQGRTVIITNLPALEAEIALNR